MFVSVVWFLGSADRVDLLPAEPNPRDSRSAARHLGKFRMNIPVGKGSPEAPTKFGRAKNMKNSALFRTTFDFDAEYLRKGST